MRQTHMLRIACAAALLGLVGTAFGARPTPGPATASTKATATAPAIDPDAVAALNKMGAYLRTLTNFEIKADTTTDAVLDNGQKVQFAGKNVYKVRRPNGFVITVADDRKVRQFYYDGKDFTVFSPRMGFYATVAAPPTIHEVLAKVYEKFGIELPLEDLFRWGTPEDHHKDLTSGYAIGYAKINGVDAMQYAFREGDVDWQVWIQQGDKPLPLKAVITTASDEARPVYSATLSWNTNPTFAKDTFTFKPPANAKPITIAAR
jgi:hypothetical protein